MKCGDRIWVLERNKNEQPYGVAVTGYIFLARAGKYALAATVTDSIATIDELLRQCAAETKADGYTELLVFPANDCFASQEEACAMLPETVSFTVDPRIGFEESYECPEANTVALRELLKEIDFDYEVENGEIRLIDEQDAYLGSIAEDRWPAEQASVPAIINRMEIYWNDYVYDGIVNPSLNSEGRELGGYEDNGSYEELLWYCEAHGIKSHLTEILYYIVHPNEVIFEEGCK